MFRAAAALLLFIAASTVGVLPRLLAADTFARRQQTVSSCTASIAAGVLVASSLCKMLLDSATETVSDLAA